MPDDRLKVIFFDALEQPADQRDQFIRDNCGGDANLETRVRDLLESHEHASGFLSETSIDTAVVSSRQPEELMPETIGGRTIIRQLGEGGFGVVYLAEQETPVRTQVAIKVVRLGMGSQQVIARFETERRALELMKHPCIAGVIDAGTTDDGRPYFVMEYVPGESITSYVKRKDLSTRARLELFEQVCFAVQHAHQKGVIHRDLKPSNVLVTEIDGKPTPKVIDFGIAKAIQGPLSDQTVITQSMQIIGTPQYMSPEQVSFGEIDIDTRSDVYSLGALLYATLTGSPPYDSKRLSKASASDLERIIREENPPKPSTRVIRDESKTASKAHKARDLRGDLDWIVARAMEKDRARRYQTPAEMGADLRRHLEGGAVEAGPPSGIYRIRKMIGRHRVEFSAAGAVALALIAVVIVSAVFATRAEQARKEAETELAKFREISRFTEEMLSGIDPAVARGADTELFRSILDDAAERIDTERIDEPVVEIELRTMIGQAYYSVAAFDLAEKQIRNASVIANERLGTEDALTLEVDSQLAQVLGGTNRYDEALELFQTVYLRRLALLGPDDEMTIEALSNVGAMQNTLGLFEESHATQSDVLERRTRTLGEFHPDTMATMNNLAATLDDLNKPDEALEILERVLKHQISADGEDHPRTLSTMNNVAFAYEEVGRINESEALYRRVLGIKRRILPPEHPSIIITMNNLAGLVGKHGDPEQAVEILEEAIAISVDASGEIDFKTLTLRSNMSTNLMRLDRDEEAVATLRLVASGFEEIAGPSNPRTINTNALLATALANLGRGEEALEFSSKALAVAIEALPSPHRIIGTAYLAHGDALRLVNRLDEAEATLLSAVEIGMAMYGENDQRMRVYYEPLRDFYMSQGDSSMEQRWASRIDALEESDQ